MIEGKVVRLRGWRESDLQILTEMRNDAALQAQLLARARGSSTPQVRQWLQDRSTDPNGLLLIVASRDDDRTLGYLKCSDMGTVDRRAELGICLHSQAQGRGVGREVLTLVIPYLRDIWSVRKLSLRVRADNSRAIACYERVGFERCGLLRQHVHVDSALRDLVLMEVLLEGRDSACAS